VQPQSNAHAIVPMDVAIAEDIVIGGGRGWRHAAGWFSRIRARFSGSSSFARFDDNDDAARSGGGLAADANGSGGQAGFGRDVLNFVDDFRCSLQFGGMYRLRVFSSQWLDYCMFCLKSWPCMCMDIVIDIDWCGCAERCSSMLKTAMQYLLFALFCLGCFVFFFLPFFFLIPVQHTSSHSGPSFIQGNCSSPRNRCHMTSRCEMQGSDSYTCSCPSWLIGSGFDDDPCICYRSFFPVPDFAREICVTQMSHLTLGWWVFFMYGTGFCALLGLLGIFLLFIPRSYDMNEWKDCSPCFLFLAAVAVCMIVPVALVGMGQPQPVSLCGGTLCTGFGQQCINNVCEIVCPPHMHAVAGVCVAGDVGNCSSAATQALCDRGARCMQLDAQHFACQCPNFFWDHTLGFNDYTYACVRGNLTCAYQAGHVMGYADSPCQCQTDNRWGNKWIPDYERRVCVDKLLRVEFWDYVTFNWLVGFADIVFLLFLCGYSTCGEGKNPWVYGIIICSLALFHGLVFGLGLGPLPKTACGSSPLDFHLCAANQQCVDNNCV
jgi:hypothetical protein